MENCKMVAKLVEKFKEIYGQTEDYRAYFAPGRVNLIGEHTDYNGGHVFPCALTLGTYAIVKNREDRKLRFYSMNFSSLRVIGQILTILFHTKKLHGPTIQRELCGHLRNAVIN